MANLERKDTTSPATTLVEQDPERQNRVQEKDQLPAEGDYPEGGFWGWLTVAGAFLVQYATFGYTSSFGVYQDYYVRVYLSNYTPSEIGWVGGAQVFFVFALGLFTGPAVDRGYFRHMMIASAAFQALALFTLSVAHQNQYYQVFLAQSVCFGLSSGLAFVPTLSIVSHYFQKKRPLAMGIVTAGSALGAVLHPIMLNKLFFGSVGFHNGVRASAALNTSLLIIANFMMRTRILPKNAATARIKEFFSDPPYVFFTIGNVLTFFTVFYPIFFIQLNAIDHGIEPGFAFYSLPILNAASIFGRILPPLFAHKLGIMNLFSAFIILAAVVACTMAVIHDVVGVTLFAITYGFCSGAAIAMSPAALATVLTNLNEMGARLGIMYAFCGIVGLVASPIAGALLTSSLNWTRASVFAGVVAIGGALFILVARWFVARTKGTQFV